MKFTPEEHAAQLRKPHGEGAESIAQYMNKGNSVLYPAAVEKLNLRPLDKVLEIGYGNGPVTSDILLSGHGITYTGIDYSPDCQRMAIGRNLDFVKDNRAVFLLGEINKLPFDNQTFNRILGINTLYFWQKPEVELSELHRVLKPEGLLVLGYRPKHLLGYMSFTEFGFVLYEPAEVEAMLKDAGFTQIDTYLYDEACRELEGKIYPMKCAVTVAAG